MHVHSRTHNNTRTNALTSIQTHTNITIAPTITATKLSTSHFTWIGRNAHTLRNWIVTIGDRHIHTDWAARVWVCVWSAVKNISPFFVCFSFVCVFVFRTLFRFYFILYGKFKIRIAYFLFQCSLLFVPFSCSLSFCASQAQAVLNNMWVRVCNWFGTNFRDDEIATFGIILKRRRNSQFTVQYILSSNCIFHNPVDNETCGFSHTLSLSIHII